jgi:photosystem II stability/assembly factor-like uncharacterized protein
VLIGRSCRSLLLGIDQGKTWRDIGQEGGLPEDLSSIVALAFPDTVTTPDRILGVGMFIANDNEQSIRMIESTDGGLHWSTKDRVPIADSLRFEINWSQMPFFFAQSADGSRSRGFLSVQTVVASGAPRYQQYLLASDDGGSTWSGKGPLPYITRKLSMGDPDNGILRFSDASATNLAVTTDGGSSWQTLTGVPLGDPQAFGNGEFRIVGGSISPVRSALIFRSSDRGGSWDTVHRSVVNEGFPVGSAAAWIDTARLYIFNGNHAWFTLNGGDSYSMVTTGLNTIEQRYASAHDDSYFYFVQTGQPVLNDIGRVRIGAGVSSVPLTARQEKLTATLLSNPARGEAVVRFAIERESDMRTALFDLLGREIRSSAIEHLNAGTHELRLDLHGLPAGHYAVRIESEATSTILPLVVLP